MASIDGLFEQIIHYEKTAQERKNFLQELRQAVFSSQEKVKVLEKIYAELQNKLSKKIGELSDKELMCKWLSSQESIYKQQLEDLEKQFVNLGEQQESVLKKLKDQKEEFCAKVSQFMTQFGPSSSYSAEREHIYTSELQDLLQQKEVLMTCLDKYSVREHSVSKLSTEKQNLQAQLEKILVENTKLTSSLCQELQKTADLEEERQSVSNTPSTDPEFISVQEQLEAEKAASVELEERYGQVQSQLHLLQQKLWQQQLKQQQQVKEQQQHPRQQQVAKQQHIKQQNSQLQCDQLSGSHDMKGSQNFPEVHPVAWQQRRNVQHVKQEVQQQESSQGFTQKSNTMKQLQRCETKNNSYQKGNSQNNSETDSCREDYSDVIFSDSEDFSGDNQESQEDGNTVKLV